MHLSDDSGAPAQEGGGAALSPRALAPPAPAGLEADALASQRARDEALSKAKLEREERDERDEEDHQEVKSEPADEPDDRPHQELQVTADYTLISRGLVNMSHVQLEASRAPEELPAPEVGDWVESKAAHQDAQIFRAKVVERRRCPHNIWIFRLRSPDMASTYVEPLKHVRKDSVWSLAREMDLARGRKTRRVSQQPRRTSSTPTAAGCSQGRHASARTSCSPSRVSTTDEAPSAVAAETHSVSAEASVSAQASTARDPSLAPAGNGKDADASTSAWTQPQVRRLSEPGIAEEARLAPALLGASLFAAEADAEFASRAEDRRRKTTGADGVERGGTHTPLASVCAGPSFLLPAAAAAANEADGAAARRSEGSPSSRLALPRRSLPAYYHLEKILKRTNLALPPPQLSSAALGTTCVRSPTARKSDYGGAVSSSASPTDASKKSLERRADATQGDAAGSHQPRKLSLDACRAPLRAGAGVKADGAEAEAADIRDASPVSSSSKKCRVMSAQAPAERLAPPSAPRGGHTPDDGETASESHKKSPLHATTKEAEASLAPSLLEQKARDEKTGKSAFGGANGAPLGLACAPVSPFKRGKAPLPISGMLASFYAADAEGR
ncbi:hypothetical protein BESB_041020 [Besnoitia besnoiti]|uniref:Uncharacterized protein n=1 Tax=Besnoitia besnoiti TaxID=94643 RepID=A0A2A9MKB0_BESBE|nr:hypothetical protein BESB_041020 [Besnoitia besnoiti]PFH37644.1 hypothetical protein BESB_041020 [Besnoitia besnoiti]